MTLVPEERLIRKEGHWSHDIEDFKRIWPFNNDRALYASFGTHAPDCYEDEELFRNQYQFHGAKIFSLRSSGGRASVFGLSPPVERSVLDDMDNELQSYVCAVEQTEQPWEGSHVVMFGSAGHALGPRGTSTRISAEVDVAPYQSERTWKKGVHLLARNREPVWRAVSLNNQNSPPVKQKKRGSRLSSVKLAQSSAATYHKPDMLFGVVTVGSDIYGDIWPERRVEPKQWWYVPTCRMPDPESDELVYCLSYPGPVEVLEMESKYGIDDDMKAAALVEKMNAVSLLPYRMSISVGDVIGANDYLLKFRASTTKGSSGGPIASLDHPLKLYGVHIVGNPDRWLTSAMESNYNLATSVNHPLWVLNYVKIVLPILSHVRVWPADYMLRTLVEYLNYHEELIQKNDMWSNVQNFYNCQAL